MSKLVFKKVVDWKVRIVRLLNVICELDVVRLVVDVLEGWLEQLNNEDLFVVFGNVGRENWCCVLEFYECLNM